MKRVDNSWDKMGIRSFIAVECNDETTLKNIQMAQSQIKSTGAQLKLVELENIHLTLKFLGDVELPVIEEVSRVIKETIFDSFHLTIEGVGVFPNLRRPRTIWGGITEGVSDLGKIFSSLDYQLSGLGFERERRRFNPHLTIARVRTGKSRDELSEVLVDLENIFFGRLLVDRIVLKKSVLTSKGPVYSLLAESGTPVDI